MASAASPADLAFREAGDGRPVVLLHAFPVDGRLFEGQLHAAQRGELPGRILAPDLPGFGGTPLPEPAPERLAVEQLAGMVASFIERHELRDAVVGGVAIGGYIALELAGRRPDLVAAMVLVSCKPASDTASMRPAREGVARRALDDGAEAVAGDLAAHPLGPGATDAHRGRMREMIAAADPRGIAGLVRAIADRPDPLPALGSLRVPTLVVGGTADPFTPIDAVRRLATLVPGARLVELEGIGHMAPLEAPDEVSAAMAGFLRGL